MPRRQQQIAADKIVVSQVFADSVNSSSTFFTKTADYAIKAADNGATFYTTTAGTYTLPASTELTPGWSIKFLSTVANAFVVDINASEVAQTLSANDRFYSIGPLQLTGNAVEPAGTTNWKLTATGNAIADSIIVTWNGTTFDVTGLVVADTYAFSAA